jgi:4-aminobutyrate aminotransferase/(S)-3-amino-2-methylpropionate transaminase
MNTLNVTLSPVVSNASLWERRTAAVPRGVGSATQRFADRAENAEIWDVEGKRYIDFGGGIGVLNTGHRHPRVMAAIEAQLQRVIHTCFQVMPYEPYVELAEKLNDEETATVQAALLHSLTQLNVKRRRRG